MMHGTDKQIRRKKRTRPAATTTPPRRNRGASESAAGCVHFVVIVRESPIILKRDGRGGTAQQVAPGSYCRGGGRVVAVATGEKA
jgi:hypothetical protein